ncbi:MAG TPA: S8 family serine peptidase [Xanthobacteraceae bacterium]
MKRHLVLKLVEQHPDDADIPHWLELIDDRSKSRDSINPILDRLLQQAGIKFWTTSEYDSADSEWDDDEIRSGLNREYRLILQNDYDLPPDLIEKIKLLPFVEDARDIQISETRLPKLKVSSATSTAASIADLIYLPYAKAITKGAPAINVAVLDTGVNTGHRELEGKIGKCFDFVDLEGIDTTDFVGRTKGLDAVVEDEVGHGTHVSGILAAKGIAMDEGICPDCRIMAVRVLATMKSGDRLVGAGIVDNINNGIKWAVDNGADIINMSLGIKHTGGGLPHEDVIRYALSKGVTVVAASGNDGTAERYYPGALPGVIAVGAVDNTGTVTNFTSYGANITVVAPGVNVYSSFAHNTYAFASGTSQASPFVSGMVALLKSLALERGAKLALGDVVGILKNTSDKADSRLRTEHAGYGLINLADAFKLLNYALN